MRVIAIDPGGTTGWCLVDDNRVSSTGQLSGAHYAELYNLLGILEPSIVVCERFVHRSTFGVDQVALEYIGVIKLFCQARELDLRMHTAAMAKQFWTDPKVKKIGLWKANQRHAVDAIRHALTYIMDYDDYYIRKLQASD